MYSVPDILRALFGVHFSDGKDECVLLCPFHKESTPSFRMNRDGRFICFGCDVRGGSVVNFIAQLYGVFEYDNEDDNNALCILANGNFKQVETVEYQRSPVSTEQKARNLAAAQDYYHGEFHGDPLANKDYTSLTPGYIYMYLRGFLAETLKYFHVIDWQTFVHHPVFLPLAFNGECWGYQQRRIRREDFPKYLSMLGQNSSEHIDGYASTNVRIGLVVEGTFDKMLAWQYGWRGEEGYACFAVIGSHVSKEQAAIIARHCTFLLSGFDTDAAGEKAHESLVNVMQPHAVEIVRMKVRAQGISKCTREDFWAAVQQATQNRETSFSQNGEKYENSLQKVSLN